MDISLQTSKSDKNHITKEIETISTVTGSLRAETSIIDPVITFHGGLEGFVNCNYMTIPEFGRSYFVTNIRSIRNDLVEVSGHVDVLSSFATQIKSNTGIVRRNENKWNLYLNDGTFKIYQNPNVLTKEFPSGFNVQNFVLAVAGS